MHANRLDTDTTQKCVEPDLHLDCLRSIPKVVNDSYRVLSIMATFTLTWCSFHSWSQSNAGLELLKSAFTIKY